MSRNFRGQSFAKPENALKRSEELVAVGQKQAAVQALHDVITSKRHRTWQKTLEDIMFKYIDLCVDMKRGRFAKDGLIQYRNVCQQVNVSSLEEVIKYFLKQASQKAEEAQAQAESIEGLAADLEETVAPEDLMLSYVSGDKSKDRTERELVTPWFKFLWETYRNVLDILRNNSKLEALYAMTAQRAFQFCVQYKRTTEFRRLCDILRNHLANLNKYREQRDRPDLTQPETLNLFLETRFEQLRTACDLEMWQEAFRSVEDIHGLMQFGKKAPKPQMMATYYAKLTQIFAISGSNLYHAYAWYKLYNLSKQYNKNLTPADQQTMGSSVLLSALSILPYERKDLVSDPALERDRAVRMATILGFAVDEKRDAGELLSRPALLADLLSKGIQGSVPAAVAELYSLLELDFDPLNLCHKLEPLLEALDGVAAEMSPASPVSEIVLPLYKEQLRKLAVLRMCSQLGQVYSVIRIEKLASMIPIMDFAQVELVIVDAVKYGYLNLRIDHRNGTVHFSSPQTAPERMAGHLSTLAKRLCKAMTMIAPPQEAEKAAKAAQLAAEAKSTLDKEHKHALARKVIIESRKEEMEQAALEQEKQEEEKRITQLRINEEAEEKRLAAERMKREEERIKKELEARELEEAQAMLQAAGKKGRVLKEGEKIDRQALMHEALTEQLKERQEMERKLARLSKQMDHFERAKREEEVPLLEEAYKQQQVDDEVYHKEQQAAHAESHRKGWEVDVAEKQRLSKMMLDRAAFQGQVVDRRAEEFARLEAARQARIAEVKAQRKMEREMERRRRYVARTRQELEDRMLEEEQARLDAEYEKQQEEVRQREAARRAEEEERRAKMEEIARKQREREEEMERKKAEERAALLAGGAAPASRPASSGDSWGRRAPAPEPRAQEAGGARTGGYRPPSQRTGGEGGGDRWAPSSRRDAPPAREGGGGDRWGASRGGPPRDGGAPPPRGGGNWSGNRDRDAPRDDRRRDDRRQAPPSRESGSRW